jgi:hypothetical protein
LQKTGLRVRIAGERVSPSIESPHHEDTMKTFGLARGIVGITGLFQLVLGIIFWTGHARSLVNVHMLVGLLFVLGLWVLAGVGGRMRASIGLVLTTVLWGVVVLVFGMVQTRLLLGRLHWIVQAAHLLMGIIAMGLAGRVQMAVRRGAAPPAPGAAVPARH